MLRRLQVYLGFMTLLIWSMGSIAMAAVEDPTEMLERVTDEMLSTMAQHRSELESNPNKIYEIVNRVLVPHVEFNEMSRWVAGRSGWSRASADERAAFTRAFRQLVIRTYAGSLNNYETQTVEYLPLRENIGDKRQIQVQSIIRKPGHDILNVSYRLVRTPSGWKVYDIIIEGVSLLKGFQNQFSAEIQREGLAAVTERIENHNTKEIQ